MELWNGEVKDIGYSKVWKPSVLAYFHPHCAKEYFANKDQPNKSNNSPIKEKLLRNLDKISLDPIGYLGNSEIVKSSDIENDYHTNTSKWGEFRKKLYKVEIEGEEIDLIKGIKWEDKKEIRKAIINEIKQNPQDWKIEASNVYDIPSQNIPDSFKILKHKSGRRHWNIGIIHFNESLEKGKKDWAEIEALINGSTVPTFNDNNNPNQISNTEKEQIRQYFLDNDIKEIRLEKGKLIITHNNNNNNNETKNLNQVFHDPKLLEIMSFCQKNNENKITKASLGLNSNNNTNSEPNKGNNQLAIGLAIGAGTVVLVGVIGYFFWKRNNKKK